GRLPPGGSCRLAIHLQVRRARFRGLETEADVAAHLAGEAGGIGAVARQQDRWMRPLYRLRPNRRVPVPVVAPFPTERLRFGERADEQPNRFLERLLRLPWVGAVGEVF